jgi:hypothetical protein
MTDGEKEKIKPRANFVNSFAIGIVLIGAFTPITRAAYDPTLPRGALAFMTVLAIVCFAIGFALHSVASRHLEGLDR